jgi:tRNA (cmo5U34)-methyltransferase
MMQYEHLISYTEITEKLFNEYIEKNSELTEITCLVPKSNESIEDLLRKNGFRYTGKRMVEGEIRIVYKWFRNLEKYEDMGEFFDRRADDYELHMSGGNDLYETGFISLLKDISVTSSRLLILDLGCGTGAELKYTFDKAPNAHIVCVDVSEKMLDILRDIYSEYIDNLEIMCNSYLKMEFGQEKFDYVIACSTLHHLLAEDKLELYRKIKRLIKPDGVLLILDYISLTEEEELTRREKYLSLIENGDIDKSQIYHIDIPLTPEHEEEILKSAGFELVRSERVGENYQIITTGYAVSPAI